MGRFLLVLLIALGLGLYFPRSREVIVEWVSPLADPAYRWMTRQELDQIATDLELHLERRGRAPFRGDEFDVWLDDRYPQERSRVDAWGTRYRAQVTAAELRVVSAGPDTEFGTDDDLVFDAGAPQP